MGESVATIHRIGKHQVLATLGKGAHSTILHIRRQADSREYALKIVSIGGKDEMKYFDQARHEFRVAQLLSHPNLIKIHGMEIQKDWFFRIRKLSLLIEFVRGKTLDLVPPLPMEKLVPIFAQVASALVHMHRRGVCHADIKPSNIMYGFRGDLKIIDYGLAKLKGESKDRIQGTPEYMAPETAHAKIVNEKTDIYNFGATLYRLSTLKLPPSCASTAAESVKITEKAWRAMFVSVQDVNRSVPKELSDLIEHCMAFKPEGRPDRMSDVYEQLKQLAEGYGEMVEGGTDPGL